MVVNSTLHNIFSAHGTNRGVEPDGTRQYESEVRLYLVTKGRVDFFSAQFASGAVSGARRFFCSFHPGDVFLLCPIPGTTGAAFVTMETGATSLWEIGLQDFLNKSAEADAFDIASGVLDRFICAISAALPDMVRPSQLQVDCTGMTTNSQVIRQGEHCSCSAGISWIEVRSGSLSLCNDQRSISVGGEMFPLAPSVWATAIEDTDISVATTAAILAEQRLIPAMESFITAALAIIDTDEHVRNSNDLCLLQKRKELDNAGVRESFTKFSQLLNPAKDHESARSANPVFAAFSMVSRQLGMPCDLTQYKEYLPDDLCEEQLLKVARFAGVRTRKVTLDDGWWKRDCGHLICFTKDDSSPVVLTSLPGGGYKAINTATGAVVRVTAENAGKLRYFAYMLYRSFPDKAVTVKSLIIFGIQGIKRDLAMVIGMGLCGSVLGLALPVVSGIIFDSVIPHAQRNQMWLLCMALVFCSIASQIFGLTQRIAMVRIESWLDLHMQGAVWDRLLKLPLPFFRKFSSGDLADRSMGINAIRQTFTGTITNSLLSALFSISSLALLFYYSYNLAFIAIAVAGVAIVIMTILGFIQIHYQKILANQTGELSGKVLEIITCIAKFRIAGAENRAFSRWAEAFFLQHKVVMKARYAGNIGSLFSEIFPIMVSIALFWAITSLSRSTPMSIGSFLAFSTAFSQFISALMSLSMCIVSISSIIPHYERCKPILESLPERDRGKEHPGKLKGDLEVSGVSFKYAASSPPILSDICLRALPGEFIAIAGPSGSGKSTLARMLLGFEKPDAGCIFYDGKDLDQLDVQQVRRQIGVVLQNGKMIAGDILTNIVGSLNLTIEHAWEAARMAGLEEDIKNMPMGMHTFISEGGGNLSGGQRQRLLIARALIAKPSILLFDEATSALDNRTQAIVNESLESLKVTRIIIAHRLSTIINADRIYVLDKGAIVESGRYADLMELDGMFADLAKRQVV